MLLVVLVIILLRQPGGDDALRGELKKPVGAVPAIDVGQLKREECRHDDQQDCQYYSTNLPEEVPNCTA